MKVKVKVPKRELKKILTNKYCAALMTGVELVQGDWEVGVVGFVDLVLFHKKSSES